MKLEKLTEPRKDWTILNNWIKRYAADGRKQGQIEATLSLVEQHDIRPDAVAEVRIKTTSDDYRRQCKEIHKHV